MSKFFANSLYSILFLAFILVFFLIKDINQDNLDADGMGISARCTSSGGSPYRVSDPHEGTHYICKFSGNSCPSGWSQFSNYSTTRSVGCSGCSSCNTGGHAFSNRTRESCVARLDHDDWDCHGGDWWYNRTCYAIITEIGCI